jgi:hypothetical protein
MLASTEDHECIQLNVTGRALHKSGQADDVASTLQRAHDWVVRGFATLTDLEIQRTRWKRRQ